MPWKRETGDWSRSLAGLPLIVLRVSLGAFMIAKGLDKLAWFTDANILAGKLHAKEVHEGDNFHFGHNAQGTTASLKELGRQFGFEVRVYPVMMVRGFVVSSSQVRALLNAGKVSMAGRLLGRPFSITGAPGRGRNGHVGTWGSEGGWGPQAPGDRGRKTVIAPAVPTVRKSF
jgi:hypothetical protein